jgi:hypothetical protein
MTLAFPVFWAFSLCVYIQICVYVSYMYMSLGPLLTWALGGRT